MKIEIDEAMVEHYQVLAKQIKPSLPEPQIWDFTIHQVEKRACNLVVSDLGLETKGSRLESGCYLCAEVSSLQ